MSMSPQQMQQLLAQYKQQFPGGMPSPEQQQLQAISQVQQGLAAGPGAGTNRTAGGVNGAAQLIAALMHAQKQKQIQQQLDAKQTQNQPQVVPMYPDQGQTTSAPAASPGPQPASPF